MSDPMKRFRNLFSSISEMREYITEEGINELMASNNPLAIYDKIQDMQELAFKVIAKPSEKAAEMIPCCFRCSLLDSMAGKVEDLMVRIIEARRCKEIVITQEEDDRIDEEFRRFMEAKKNQPSTSGTQINDGKPTNVIKTKYGVKYDHGVGTSKSDD